MKKLLGILVALAMVLSVVLPLNKVSAQEASETYDVVVHKILLQSLDGFPKNGGEAGSDGQTKYDGSKIDNIEAYFGNGAKTVQGVHFQAVDNSGDVKAEGVTGPNGEVILKNLPAGTYTIKENKEKTKLAGEYEGKMPGSTIPITITLPVYKANGGKFTNGDNSLHVYPKNTIDEPTIEKSVTESKNMHDTVGIGETKPFIIESVMPDGISDYSILKYTDQFSSGLSYQGNLKVELNGNLVSKDKYEKTEPAVGTKGAKIVINFKKNEFIKTLNKGDKIKITYNATVNEDAIMGKENPNKIKLEYGTNPDSIKEKTPDNPELHTGGKKFKKQDPNLSGDKGLKDAEFKIKNKEGKYLKQEKNTLKISWVEEAEATIFKSGENGLFEVKGLPYGKKGQKASEADSTKYYLVETKAPDGYALNKTPIEFEVNATSYYKDPTSINLVPQDPKLIDNNKVTIPQTGGIGSVIVVAGGVLITALGIYVKRKNLEV